MSDDNGPQGPTNPFVRFKNHVNARIGTGVSVFTGTTDDRDKPQNHADHHGATHPAPPSPWPNRNQSPGGSSRQSSVIDFWDDWCHVDPYSPHNLQHLPQPTPKDLPSGADPADFGFPEAFEDLMYASNPFRGRLMDLGMRAGLKRSATGKLVQPETPSAWVRRLYGDALLPPPFIWEQPRPAGRQPHAWGAFETAHRAQHSNVDNDDVARAYREVMRQIDQIEGSFDGSFPDFEDIVGRDVAEMMRKGRDLAEKVMGVRSAERSEEDDSGSSHANGHGDAKPAPAGEQDQPLTEEDLFEMIRSASAEADKFFGSFNSARARARQDHPPAERTARDTPPVKETVEHDPSGGKTIRTSSEHVDTFGFIHSRIEVRRLNAKGETVDYDTRYSVRSSADGFRGDRARQEDYRPRSDAPVSVLMTPEQYAAFIGKSSDEQLEAFRASTAEADESSLDPNNLALKNKQLQLIIQEQQRRARLRDEARRPNNACAAPNGPNHALQDYQLQLRLLEEQNKRRVMLGKEAASSDAAAPRDGEFTSQDHETGLKVSEGQGRERLKRAEEEEEESAARPATKKTQEKANSERSGWFWR